MKILFIEYLNSNEIIKATCWALVHSLWQGLLLAILAGFIVLITKKLGPSIRYNLLAVLFLLFVVTSCCTFIIELKPFTFEFTPDHSVTFQKNVNTPVAFNINSSYQLSFNSIVKKSGYYFDQNATVIVTIWLIILTTRLIKMFTGLSYIHRIRNHKVSEPGDHWKRRIQQLQKVLRINEPIILMESGLIKVPLVTGWLKPMILVPLGIFTELSPEQMEAILLHELAHIKRRDYFINLLQSFAEIIFFFNPAVLWISSLIRDERENCCDDMAITVTKSKTKFVHALVSFQELNVGTPYAMAFPGRKAQLLNRVQRIIHNRNKTLDSVEKAFIAACCLVITVLVFLIPNSSGTKLITATAPFVIKKIGTTVYTRQPDLIVTTTNAKASSAVKSDQAKLTHRNNVRIIKQEEKLEHKENINTINLNFTGLADKVQISIRDLKINAKIGAVSLPGKIYEKEVKDSSGLHLQKTEPLVKLIPLQNHLSLQSEINIHLDYKSDSSLIVNRYKAFLHNGPSSNRQNRLPVNKGASPSNNPLANPIITDLIKEHIVDESVIKNMEDFSFLLNNQELVVQGIQQAKEIYQKIRSKYINPTGETTHSYIWKN